MKLGKWKSLDVYSDELGDLSWIIANGAVRQDVDDGYLPIALQRAELALRNAGHVPRVVQLNQKHAAEFMAMQEETARVMATPIPGTGSVRHEVKVARQEAPCGGAALWDSQALSLGVPAEQLPRVVRELAAMLTENQRKDLGEDINGWREFAGVMHYRKDGINRVVNLDTKPPIGRLDCPQCDWATLSDTAAGRMKEFSDHARAIHRAESGPGISALPERREQPLSFLDEDLLCDDE